MKGLAEEKDRYLSRLRTLAKIGDPVQTAHCEGFIEGIENLLEMKVVYEEDENPEED